MNDNLAIPIEIKIGKFSEHGEIKFGIGTEMVPGRRDTLSISLSPADDLSNYLMGNPKPHIPTVLRLLADALEAKHG